MSIGCQLKLEQTFLLVDILMTIISDYDFYSLKTVKSFFKEHCKLKKVSLTAITTVEMRLYTMHNQIYTILYMLL